MTRTLAYRNGQWVDPENLTIDVADLGFAVGATVVERLRTFGLLPFRLETHQARLKRSLEIVRWDAVNLTATVERAVKQFPDVNSSAIADGDDWSIAVFITPGLTADAATPTVCVHGYPLQFSTWADQYDQGVPAVFSDVRQIPPNCWPSELKCRSRMHYYLADCLAESQQPGARAILLDQNGFVGEASTANVIAHFQGDGLAYPRLDNVLPGVSQQVVFELAQQLGLACNEADITPERLRDADEIMLASTSVCLLPVTQLDGVHIGEGRPGPIYRLLLQAWSQLVGVNIVEQARRFAQRPAK